MRHCTVVVAFVWILLPSLPAQTIRVATWELEKVEATSLDASTSEGEGKRLGQIAGSLRSTDAGIIILRPKRQDKRAVLRLMDRILLMLTNRPPMGELWIVEPDRIRFRTR